MIEYILNGKTVKVSPENEEAFLKANPSAEKKTSWWKGEEGYIPDELEFWKNKQETESPGKSQEAGQPQSNQQQEDTESSSEPGSLELLKYKIGNKIVKVKEEFAKIFEKENPNAELTQFAKGSILDKWTDGQNNIPQDKGFVADIILSAKQTAKNITDFGVAAKQGWVRGRSTSEAFDVYGKGANISDEELANFIAAAKKMDETPQTEAEMHFHKTSEEHGGGVWGTIKALSGFHSGLPDSLKSWTGAGHLIASSLTTLAGSLEAEQTLAAGGTVGGAAFRATKSPWVGVGGAFAGVVGAMETSLTLTSLLKEELERKGIDPYDYENGFTDINIRDILEDPEAIERIKKKSLARGVTIGAIEGLTLGLSRGVASSVARKTMSKTATAVAAATTEGIGGATGELGGLIVEGGVAEDPSKTLGFDLQKGLERIDSREVFLEGLLELPGGVFSTDIISRARGQKYKINGEDVTKKRVVSILQDKELSTAERAKILSNIDVENDATLQAFVNEALDDVTVELNIDAKVIDQVDRKRLVELRKKQMQAERDAKKTGVFAVPDAEKNLNDINAKIEEIITPYQNQVDSTLADVTIQEKEAAEFNQSMAEKQFKGNLEFAKKHSAIYGLEVDDTLTQEQIREKYGDELAESDGGIQGNKIIINTEVASQTRAVNVGNHELLHGILRKAMKDNPGQFNNIRQELKAQIGESQWQKVEDRATAVDEEGNRLYTDEYFIKNPDEWITLTSDAIANGDITYSESIFQPLMDLFLPIIRAAGFKKIKFDSGKDVFEFLKEYNRSIHKGSLSGGIVKETGGFTETTDTKYSKSNLDGMLDEYGINEDNFSNREGGNLYRMVNSTLSTKPDGQPIDMLEGDRAFFNSIFGKEIGGIVEDITQRLYDKISDNAKRNVSRDQYKTSLITMAGNILWEEYQFKQPVDKFITIRTNLRAERLAEKLGIESAEVTSKQDRIDRRFAGEDTQRQIEDTTQPEAEFETQDLSIQKQIQEGKGLFETKKKGEFVKKNLKFTKETNDSLNETAKKINYDVDGKLFEDVKEDMQSQVNSKETSKNRVRPTGILYPVLEIISENEFGVNAGSILAKPQTLTVPESISARTKIAEAMERSGPQKVMASIFPNVNFNPKSEKSIGIRNKILELFYIDGNLRIPNLYGKMLNVDKMSDADILAGFGINPDFTLMEYNRSYDGAIKGFIDMAAAFAFNQEARVVVDKPAAQVGIGKSDIAFSKSIKNAYRQSPADIAKRIGIKLMPGATKNRAKNSVYQTLEDGTKETWAQARDRVVKDFLTKYPEYRLFLQKGLCASSSRTIYVSVSEFNKAAGPIPQGVEVIKVPRTEYHTNRKFTEKAFNKFKTEKFKQNEKKKLKALKDFFLAIEDYLKTEDKSINPDTWLFLEMLRDSSSAGQGHIIRILAPVKFYTINQRTRKPIYNQDVVEEHTDPQNQIGTALMDAAINGKVKEVFDVIGKSYMQGSLLHTSDNLIGNKEKNPNKRDLSKDMPDIYFNKILLRLKNGSLNLPDGMASVVRMAVQGVNMNQLMLIDSNQTIAEFFGVGINTKNMTDAQIEYLIPYQNELIVNFLAGSITKKKATNSINEISKTVVKKTKAQLKASINSRTAVLNTFKYSKTGKTRGMSTFDFDDTLASTKSGVRARIPNIDELPKPKRKVIFLAGGAGSGKGNVISKLNLEKQGFKIVNQDISLEWLKKNSGLPANMRELTKEQRSTLGKLSHQARGIARRKMMKYQGNAEGVVVDGTGGSIKMMGKLVDEFKARGYDVSMLFVETSLETALERNRARAERSLLDIMVRKNHEAVQGNKSGFKDMFGNRFMEVNTDNLKQKDAMPSELVDKMDDFVSGYERIRLDAEQFAAEGGRVSRIKIGDFDFSEFSKVIEGKEGPLLKTAIERAKKYGTKDMFVLTARPQEAAGPIHEFLKSQGLDIPVKNITGLANSTGEAKAMWMLEKFAEGYNDMYFVDDAMRNVKAVKNVLDQLDIKSKVVQAKIKFSKTASENFNTILEESQGTSRSRTFSSQEAKRTGANKGWWRIFVPPSAEDFKGLLYRFLGEDRQGELHMKYFKMKLLDPFSKGIRAWNIYKQEMVNEYEQLRENMPGVVEIFDKKLGDTGFTAQDAIRVYLWDKAGFDVPGLDASIKQRFVNYIKLNPKIKAFADTLGDITKTKEGYVSPTENWGLGTISTDLNKIVNKVGRKEFLAEYLFNAKAIFTPDNMNKIEALYGTGFRDALENIMYRMENGGNRMVSNDKVVNRFVNWINGSVGAIMFLNMRSALLQTISTVNFLNWSDNNIFKASAAFANGPQFWKDFAMLFNSPQLKQRRAGIQIDVSASELSRAFSERKGTPQGVINWLLEKGFTPTRIADSFAIAMGGASFVRNRINTYIKQGLSEANAMEKAMLDFQEIAEETQQSSREDLVSQQQASVLGRIILAFQNVTMQYTRLTKKALSDLVNGRGDTKTNISKILYYGMVQNIIFASLQSALAMMMWGDDEEEIENKTKRTLNSALDSFLRGTGIYGAIISTIKNTVIQHDIQKKLPGWKREDGKTILEIINLSPPIGSKLRKIWHAIKTEQYNKGVSEELGLRIENPTLWKWASVIEAATNIPTERVVKKANNLEEAITGDHLLWQRIFLVLGWNRWDIGVKDEELEAAKKEAKANRSERTKDKKKKDKKEEEKDMKKKGMQIVRCSGKNSRGKRCGLYSGYIKEKTWKCMHHMTFKDGMDRDGDGVKEYRCKAITKSNKRCKNKTENKSKKCYAHQ